MKFNVLVIKQYCDIEVNVSKQVKGVSIELNVRLFPSGEDNVEMCQVDFNIVCGTKSLFSLQPYIYNIYPNRTTWIPSTI